MVRNNLKYLHENLQTFVKRYHRLQLPKFSNVSSGRYPCLNKMDNTSRDAYLLLSLFIKKWQH